MCAVRYLKLLLLFIALLSLANVTAQVRSANHKELVGNKIFSNSFKLTIGDYYVRNTFHDKKFYNQIGALYERRVYGNIYAGTGFVAWNPLYKKGWQPTSYSLTLCEENSVTVAQENYHPVIDGIEERLSYKMVDVYAFYKYQIGKSSHFVSVGAGASYNWGFNSHLQAYYTPTPDEIVAYYYNAKAAYWGVIANASYNYCFYRSRFVVGLAYQVRYYPERIKIQHDFSLQTGVNF